MQVTTLQVYCATVGWQGGTIHQAESDFRTRPMSEKDRICNALMRELDARTLTDVATAATFFRARLGA